MRRVLSILIALLLAEAAYLGGTYCFLNSEYLKRELNASPDELLFRFERAWSPYPGKVYVRNFSLRMQDSNVQFFFLLRKANIDVKLFPLLRRKFETSRMRGDELSFSFRMRRKGERVSAEERATLPEIPGLSLTGPAREKPRSRREGWRAALFGVEVNHIRELWFESFHFRGLASVKGGFWLRPGREAEVRPALLTFYEGRVDQGTKRVVSRLKGSVAARIFPFLSADIPGLEIFRYVTSDIDLAAHLDDASFLNFYLKKTSWLRFHQGEGELRALVRLDKGKLCRSSEVDVSAPRLAIWVRRQQAIGAASARWRVVRKSGNDIARLDVHFRHFRVGPANATAPGKIHGRDLRVRMASSHIQLPSVFAPADIELRMPRARIEDLSAINEFLPRGAGVRFTRGNGWAWAYLHTSSEDSGKGADKGEIGISVAGASAEYEAIDLTGDVIGRIKIRNGSLGAGRFDISGSTLEVSNAFQIDGEKKTSDEGWWGILKLPQGELQFQSQMRVAGRVQVIGRDARPLISFLVEKKQIPGIVGALFSFENLQAASQVRFDEDGLSLSRAIATGNGTRVRAWVERHRNLTDGRVLIEYGPLAAGIELKQDHVGLHLWEPVRWFEAEAESRRPAR